MKEFFGVTTYYFYLVCDLLSIGESGLVLVFLVIFTESILSFLETDFLGEGSIFSVFYLLTGDFFWSVSSTGLDLLLPIFWRDVWLSSSNYNPPKPNYLSDLAKIVADLLPSIGADIIFDLELLSETFMVLAFYLAIL